MPFSQLCRHNPLFDVLTLLVDSSFVDQFCCSVDLQGPTHVIFLGSGLELDFSTSEFFFLSSFD